MENKFELIWYNMFYYLGCVQEHWMAFRFNVAHYIRHGRRPVRMSPEMFARFRKFADENYKKQ